MNDYDPLDIHVHEAALEEKELKRSIDRDNEEADFKWLMSSKRGRRIVWRILEQSGVFRSSFSTTAMQMAFNEGYRNLGNRTLGLIHNYCPELYPIMLKENTNVRNDGSDRRNNQ